MYRTGILRSISNSVFFKAITLLVASEMLIQIINPPMLFALTSGPTQPEVEAFQPIGVTDMVDPFTGDFSYNIPLMNVGDYPLNLAYQSGVTMDDEASWAGLGWNVHTGAITRQMRGLPDDFWGDEVIRNVHLRDNLTVGAKVMLGFETFGADPETFGVNLGVGFDVNYNTYKGLGLSSMVDASLKAQSGSNGMNLGLSLASGPEGLNVSPNISFSGNFGGNKDKSAGSASLGFGFNINSRAGLSGMTLSRGVSLNGTKGERKSKKDEFKQKDGSHSVASHSSSISLGQPTFSPQIDLPMINSAGSGRFKIGGAVFGLDIDVAITGYGSKQKLAKNQLKNAAFGYMYSEKGNGNLDALHDFNREKDGTFTKEKKNLPLTNYTYDLYSISAQGVGGTFRAYRNDAGYVYDKRASSPSTSIDFGLELGPGNIVDFGLDFNANILESESRAWTHGNAAAQSLKFKSKEADQIKENFHFKLTGEQNIDSDPTFHSSLRNGSPVRFDLDGNKNNFEVPAYNKFVESNGSKYTFSQPERTNRQYRNTAVYHFTANEILKAYPWKAKRISPHAKSHHIAEITVIQPDGKRYVFGLAAYNTLQREMSFNVGKGGSTGPLSFSNQTGLVSNANQSSIAPGSKRGIDHFYDETITPAYAHTWMLTEILSADYVDVGGDGPTPDDLGSYTKFNYGNDNIADVKDFEWRTPTTGGPSASYMEGLKTDYTDDKGSIIYGKKDVWYVQSIESKTQIAVFHTSTREDALGANIDGVIQSSNNNQKLRKLDAISLYSKQEYDQTNHTPVPIKTAHFKYDYSLCPGTPNSLGGPNKGKLTLRKIYFTYKNSFASQFSPYEFEYREQSQTVNQPFSYRYGQVDRWGVPRPNSTLPPSLTHAEWPYATQKKTVRDDYSSAWHLEKIKLPSGGHIKVKYESDDYGFVQDKAAMRMYKIKGLATSPTATPGNSIFPFPAGEYRDYIILDLPDASINNSQDFRKKYLTGYGKGNLVNNAVKHLYFRFMINVNGLYNPHQPQNPTPEPEYEYVSGYVEPDLDGSGYNVSNQQAYIKIKRVSAKMLGIWTDVSPFAYSAWQFSRLNTPRKAFDQPEPTDDVMDQIVQTLASANMAAQIISFFQGPNGSMYAKGLGSTINPAGSWVRLMEPEKTKLGGGNRVKEITISNEWNSISEQEPTSVYGQEFSYTDDEGRSSGVAAYEPGVGADENPWRVPSYYDGPKQILIPDERFYMEEPFGESFFPGPSIGYSKVTIKDKVFDPNVTVNTTGKVVHEFYTSFDFPTTYTQTGLEIQPREENVILQLFSPLKRKYMTASQGYTVTLNDMHGKPKSVSMYAQGETAPFSYTKYHYKMTNGKLSNTVDVIDRDGKVYPKTIGLETDFVADMREQSTTSENIAANGNLATFLCPPGPVPVPVLIPTIMGSFKTEKTRYRSATTTKVIQQFGVQDVTETYDKGAYVQTRITAYDARTGAPLVQELNNEFKDKYYKLDYPSHWAYTGMGQASENIGYIFSYAGGALSSAHPLEPGDEVLPLGIKITGRGKAGYPAGNANNKRYWVAQDDVDHAKYLIDDLGHKYNPSGEGFYQVIRSGHRNMQSSSLGSITSIASPIRTVGSDKKIVIDASSKVIAANAMEYAERWKTSRDMPMVINNPQYTIIYDDLTNGWVSLLNDMITANYFTVFDFNNSFNYSQYPYVHTDILDDCSFTPNTFLYTNLVGGAPGYPSVGLGCIPHTAAVNLHLEPWRSWPATENISAYKGLLVDIGFLGSLPSSLDGSDCSRPFTIVPFENCTNFTPTDWDNILYFELPTQLDPQTFNTYDNAEHVFMRAVFPGGVKKDVLLGVNGQAFNNILDYGGSTPPSGPNYNPITYDGRIHSWISLFNDMITDGHFTTFDLSNSFNYSQYPYVQSSLLENCEFTPSTFLYTNLVGSVPGYPSVGLDCIPHTVFENLNMEPWISWPTSPLTNDLSTYKGVLIDRNYLSSPPPNLNGSSCSCNFEMAPFDDCDEFSPSDWDNIIYFELPTGLTQQEFNTYNTSKHVLIRAVFAGGIKKDILFGQNCQVFTYGESTTPTATGCISPEGIVNPYLYGILGNWRTKGDYFYMGDRNNISASTAENLRNDGYLPSFKSYWKAPASTTGVWVRNTPAVSLGDYENWNWKTEMTLYSPYGFDVENINALPTYSSAQYGYFNTLPTAVANNAKQKEIGFDGFEDYYPWIEQPECIRSHFAFEEFKDKVTQDQSHTGLWSMRITNTEHLTKTVSLSPAYQPPSLRKVPFVLEPNDLLSGFSPDLSKAQKFVLSFWAKPETRSHTIFDYTGITPEVHMGSGTIVVTGSLKKSKLINDWQRYELYFDIPSTAGPANLTIDIANTTGQNVYVDDIRVHPFDANIKTFVYHMFDFKYMAQLDENNFATFYEYDAEGKLVRVKKETERGIMTLQENRSNMYKR